MNNMRQSERKEIDLEVELSSHEVEAQIAHTRDISDGGMYLFMNENDHIVPAIGEVVELRLVGASADRETLPESAAVVVHKANTGVGLAYVKMELDDDF